MRLHHAGCFGRVTNAINFRLAVRVETNPNIQFCSCNFFNKKITRRDNRMWFALIFVSIVTLLCQSASLASNFTFLASNFSLWKTNKNAFPGFVCVPSFLCRCCGLGRVITNAISWSVGFIVFQCY